MSFSAVAMGILYYSLPPALIMFLHDHLYASRTLMEREKKKTLPTQEAALRDCLYVETGPVKSAAVSIDYISKHMKNMFR